MKRVVLLAAVALWGALLLPTTAAANPPATTAEQVQWLGDCYAAGLDHYYGRYGLTAEAIQTARGEFASRLKDILRQPLDRRQFSEVSAFTFEACASIGAPDIPPPALRLRQDAADLSHIVALYLSRPPLTREQQDEIAGQLGDVLDVLREAMLEEFSQVPGAEALVRTAIYARAADFGRTIKHPLSPLIKRAYTAEEIEELCAYAREIPRGEYADYLHSAAMDDPESPDFEDRIAEAAMWTIQGVSWCFKAKVMGFQYAPPPVLSAEEQQAVWDYYRTTAGALSEDHEAMQKRVEEMPW